MAEKVNGRDVTVYSVALNGYDGSPTSGAVSSLLGRWESIDVTLTNEWSDVTSSDASQPEKRFKRNTWTASLKTWIDTGGSQAVLGFLSSNLVVVTFTERNSGKTIILRGGIQKSTFTLNADHGKDTLEIEDVGGNNFGGAVTFAYA